MGSALNYPITLLLSWLLLTTSVQADAQTSNNSSNANKIRAALQSHQWSAQTVIAFPGTEQFTNATERWEVTFQPSYAASISPATEEDVAAAVKIAVRHKINFLPTGGRHGFGLGYGKLQNGLAIDLGNFKSFEADVDAATVTIGGAATAGEFADELYAAGLMLPSGSCACPGYVGLGVGGLVTDRIISARVVTAKGDLITVSADENADLFWGMRGAGANLGIITSATFQAARASDHSNGYALNIDMYFAPNATAAYFQHLESIADGLPGNVGGVHLTHYNETNGRAELFVNWVWFGEEQDGRNFVKQFLALNPYTVENFEYIPWRQIIPVAGNGIGEKDLCVNGGYANTYASNIKAFSAATYQSTFETLAKFYVDYPEARGSNTNLEVFPNQAVAALPDDFDAYPWRDVKAFYTVSAVIDADSLSNQTIVTAGDNLGRGLRENWTKTGGYAEQGGTIYVNYGRGDESVEAVFGKHLPRLAALKKKWDPSNVFRYNNPLPTAYP
ncbi:Glucooligosaccharide oxidase [Xylaria sp. CBS 124048]|nr:Glucooligosaccharide oxidase [Xylaria sp. CBS 124048]